MSTYAIQAVSDPQAIIQAHRQRGFDVLTLAESWAQAKALAGQMGTAQDGAHLMVVSTLARKVHQAQRQHAPAFGGPTLVVMPGANRCPTGIADWRHVQAAADAATHEVVFLHASA